MAQRKPGDSQLDFLWNNYGNREVITEASDDLESIPSLGLVKELLKSVSTNAVGSIKREGSFLVVKSAEGVEMNRFDIKELQGVTSVTGFGKRVVSAEDKEAGCDLELYTPVYYLTLDNGKEFLTPAETYIGNPKGTISTIVQDNVISSRLNLSKNEENGIILKEEQDGLSGEILLDGADTGLHFAIKSDRAYNSLQEVKKNTIYLIKDRPYLYFNEFRIGGDSEVDVNHLISEAKEEIGKTISDERERAIRAELKLEDAAKANSKSITTLNSSIKSLSESFDKELEGYVKEEEYNNLKSELDSLKKWTENMFKSDTDTITDIRKGGQFTLVKNIKSEKDITLTKNTELDLGGHTLSAVGGTYGDNIVIGNGATITIENGEIAPSDKANLGDQSATIIVKTAYESHLTLTDTKVTGIYPIYLNSANESSSVVINSGEYYSSYEMNPAVYVGKGSSSSTIGGKVTIYGGTFGQPGVTHPYLLNVEDILRKQEGKEPRNFIEVFGGKFYNFNPADNKAEGEGTSFVAEGYTVEQTESGQDTIYTVVPIV